MRSTCRAATPNCTQGVSPVRRAVLDGLRAAAARGAVVFGECGGYMVLGRGLTDADGRASRHGRAAAAGDKFSRAPPFSRLSPRCVWLAAGGPLGAAGTCFRGHEFHYCRVVSEEADRPLFETRDATGASLGHVGMTRGHGLRLLHPLDRPGLRAGASPFVAGSRQAATAARRPCGALAEAPAVGRLP